MKSNLITLLPTVIILLGILPSSTLGRAQGQTFVFLSKENQQKILPFLNDGIQ